MFRPLPAKAGLRALVLAAALGAAFAGCGSSAPNSTAQVKKTIVQELAAVADGDGKRACQLATPAGQAALTRGLTGAGCAEVISLFGKHLSSRQKAALLDAYVKRVTINGNTATVQDADIGTTSGHLTVFVQPGSGSTVLTKQPDGSWKISAATSD